MARVCCRKELAIVADDARNRGQLIRMHLMSEHDFFIPLQHYYRFLKNPKHRCQPWQVVRKLYALNCGDDKVKIGRGWGWAI